MRLADDIKYLRSFEHRDELGAHGVVVLRSVLDAAEDMQTALKPFADRAFIYDGQDAEWFCSLGVQVRHIRAAHTALSKAGA